MCYSHPVFHQILDREYRYFLFCFGRVVTCCADCVLKLVFVIRSAALGCKTRVSCFNQKKRDDAGVNHPPWQLQAKCDLTWGHEGLFSCLMRPSFPSKETAAWNTCQVPHLVSLLRGSPVLYQHLLTSHLPSVAGGKEQDNYRYLKINAPFKSALIFTF